MEGPGNRKREPKRLRNKPKHRGSAQPTSENHPSISGPTGHINPFVDIEIIPCSYPAAFRV
jgi:hypothetical protein